ncbi:calpain-C-like [Ostrinia furnacalis]|uniref:calpain-C-like n=1 Tax=Ostrinia furnacalis TaxID=93504 RepID=UPI00103AEC57|nr:calpain-C-like [Ostrinia furnacalis]
MGITNSFRRVEIYTNPTFVQDNCDTFDVVPGKLGDKWLVSCLGVLYLSKGLFYRVVPADQRMDTPYAGVFRFRLWWCGQWLEVLVDDRLPTVNGKLAFLQTSHTGQLWPALLEKAYAKLHGSYEALKYGSLLDGLADLTGGITESAVPGAETTDAASLANLLTTTSVVTAHHFPAVIEEKIKGLELEMNYRIYNIEKVRYLLSSLKFFNTFGTTKLHHAPDILQGSFTLHEISRVKSKKQWSGNERFFRYPRKACCWNKLTNISGLTQL